MSITTPVAVALKANTAMVGIMIAMPVITLNNELVVKCAVVWENPEMRTPCPSFHSPEDLVSLGCPAVEALFEDVEDDEDESPLSLVPDEPVAEDEADEPEPTSEGETLA